ncbi:DUF503 family protein [Mycobacterium mantenii]|uniref:DUF503 family protein n=1 Tax=Mycobacterium mantenii TaxID=560555 RepID=UPI003D6DE65A
MGCGDEHAASPTAARTVAALSAMDSGRCIQSAAETGSHELYRRAGIGVATVSGDRAHAVDVLDAAERLVAAHPEFELLSVRRSLVRSDDLA